MVVQGPIVEGTLAERLTNEKKILEGLVAKDTFDLLVVKLPRVEDLWSASYSDSSLVFNFSNRDNVKLKNIGFNALNSSCAKAYPSK